MTEAETTTLSETLLRQADFLRALARGLLGDEHTSDDVVQSTWVAALEHGRGPLRKPRAWLARVARNLAIQRRRETGRRAERELAAARPESLAGASESLEREESLRSVTQAVLALAEPYRSTILLRYFEGLELSEIAERRREPLATIRSRHSRALAQLRARLDRAHGGDRRAWSLGLAALMGERFELASGVGAVAGVTTGAVIMSAKIKLVVASAAILLALAALRFGRPSFLTSESNEPSAAAPDLAPASRSPDAPIDSDTDGARVAAEPGSTSSGLPARGSAPSASSKPAARWTGRVVDGRRMPVADASILVRLGASKEWTAKTGSEGTFEIPVLEELRTEADSSGPDVLLLARGLDGAIAVKVGSRPGGTKLHGYQPPRAAEEVPTASFGTVVLRAPCSLDVKVSEPGAVAAGATVELETSEPRGRVVMASAQADASGIAHFDALPPGIVRVRAFKDALDASGMAYLPDDAAIELALEPMREFLVEVIDGTSGEPIPGARVSVHEMYPSLARFDEDPMSRSNSYTSRKLRRAPAVTGPDGRARLERLPSTGSFDAEVEADGYSTPYGIPPAPRFPRLLPAGQVLRVALKPAGGRTVRWPIVAGEAPVPPDGSTIAMRFAPGSRYMYESLEVPSGRMEGSTLVVDGLEHDDHFLASAPDGTLAQLRVEKGADLGVTSSFRRPRSIEVTVRDARGAPVRGASAIARNQGNNPLCDFVSTDEAGRAVLSGLYGTLADVYVHVIRNDVSHQVRAGSIDLEKGDGRVEAVLPATFPATLVVRIDGVPRLPASFQCNPSPIEEIPERGELRFELVAPDNGAPVSIWLRSVGYAPASAEFAPTADGRERVAEVELSPAGELFVDVHRTSNQRVEILPERFEETDESWGPDRSLLMSQGLRTANGPHGGFRFAGLAPGRWRAVDKLTGVSSGMVEISRSVLRARVALDVASVQWVSGRVEVPAGEVAASAVVLVEGTDASTDRQWWDLPGEAPPPGARVAADGSFKVQIPGDRVVRVAPWHPWLAPTVDGVLETRAGLDGAVLKLERGREVRIPAEEAVRAGAKSLRIAAYPGEIGASPPRWVFAPVVDGVARTADLAPGRWSLWIDAGKRFAPVTVHDLEIGSGVTTIPALQLSTGSSLRVRIRTEGDEAPPRIYVIATSGSEPKFWRDVNSNGESEVVLPGLSAGRYSLDVSLISTDRPREPREIELDGVNDLVVDFPR